MEATTYYAVSAEQLLIEAQAVLDEHVTSSGSGRCLACDSPGPAGRPPMSQLACCSICSARGRSDELETDPSGYR
jgi:hypothetical protein